MAGDYYLALGYTGLLPKPITVRDKVIFYDTIGAARAEARRQCDTFSDIDLIWILKIVKEGARFVGCVKFDRSKAGYRGLGWVYISPDRARAVKLYRNGDIAEFKDSKDLRYARNLRQKYWT